MNENKKINEDAYESQEKKLASQSAEFIKLLTERGILGEKVIDDDKVRQAQKEKKRRAYHNTELLLRNYRDIVWALECFPQAIAEELDRPLEDLDAIINYVDMEMSRERDNNKLKNRRPL